MYCRNCGTYLEDDAKFCTVCGSKASAPAQREQEKNDTQDEVYDRDFSYEKVSEDKQTIDTNPKQTGVESNGGFNTLALVGFILGVSGVAFGIPGLILSIKGLNAADNEGKNLRGMAKAGKILSIVWMVLGPLLFLYYVFYFMFIIGAIASV